MIDRAFFGTEFTDRVREFASGHSGLDVRVEIVTAGGDRLDLLELEAVDEGVRLVTRDERLVFLPYAQIVSVDVSLLRDHRVAGFRLPESAE